jgi:N-acetylglutamate synthase/N-acetylornithine aminotransferase
MTDWTKEEDEEFNSVEQRSNLGKQILRDIEGQPYHFDVFVSTSQRNQVLEEVAREIEKMTVFGKDTISSFTIVIRNMKRTEG